MNIEICVDNISSLKNAQRAGASRIELCSSLSEGGLTPGYGLIKVAYRHASIPIYCMIRPRGGDFLYSDFEVEMMLEEIHNMRTLGVQGVVVGALTDSAMVDRTILKSLVSEAKDMGVTFHRAIDCCENYEEALEDIIELGCERVLTSGLASTALKGADTIKKMVRQSSGRISIMAGSGVSCENVLELLRRSEVDEVHLSGKSTVPTLMKKVVNCGVDTTFQSIDVTNYDTVRAIRDLIVLNDQDGIA